MLEPGLGTMTLGFQTDKEILEKIVQRLSSKRKHLKLSQKELAARAGISFRTVQTLETGGNCTSLNLIAIIRSLGELPALSSLIDSRIEEKREFSPKEIHERNKGKK